VTVIEYKDHAIKSLQRDVEFLKKERLALEAENRQLKEENAAGAIVIESLSKTLIHAQDEPNKFFGELRRLPGDDPPDQCPCPACEAIRTAQ
jgi:FtsZ-binding cell division protein ZapB